MAKYFSGKDAHLWLNESMMQSVQSFNAKIAGDYEEIKNAGTGTTEQYPLGFNGSGSLKVKKTSSALVKFVADRVSGKVIDEATLTSKIDGDNGQSERLVLIGVTFDEVNLADWEAGKVMEEEIPFKFRDYDFPDRIGGNL